MKFKSLFFIIVLSVLVQMMGCRTEQIIIGPNSDDPNFKFIGFETDIDNPNKDRRSYYKIYIDKVDEGRTTIGLESQKNSISQDSALISIS